MAPESNDSSAEAWDLPDQGGQQDPAHSLDVQVRDLGHHAGGLPTGRQLNGNGNVGIACPPQCHLHSRLVLEQQGQKVPVAIPVGVFAAKLQTGSVSGLTAELRCIRG